MNKLLIAGLALLMIGCSPDFKVESEVFVVTKVESSTQGEYAYHFEGKKYNGDRATLVFYSKERYEVGTRLKLTRAAQPEEK